MKRMLMMTVLLLFAAVPMGYLAAHCEVPCGIYDDGARFKGMMEDQDTIAKAINGIVASADTNDATGHNQLARWVATKESHATNIQHTIAQYFMTQRIKSADPKYVEKLTAAHAVMVAAMKCKQAAEPDTAEALGTAIHDFQHAYEADH
jgi:nickel superoxide dismutase